jgi:hypothetical protein
MIANAYGEYFLSHYFNSRVNSRPLVGLTLDDIALLSPKFWKFHSDPIICDDPAATTLLAIQFNLVIGTILDTVGKRPDLAELLQELVEYKISYILFFCDPPLLVDGYQRPVLPHRSRSRIRCGEHQDHGHRPSE